MSLFSAMTTAVSGLSAHARKMGHISDNIANVSTIGYKKIGTNFSTLVTQSDRRTHSPGGVISTPSYNVSLQGQVQSSSKPTHLAVNGGGFFIVRNFPDNATTQALNRQNFYTRRGDFSFDANGNLVNASGYYLQGRAYDPRSGELMPGDLRTVSVHNMAGLAVATNNVRVGANLPADSRVTTITPGQSFTVNLPLADTDEVTVNGVSFVAGPTDTLEDIANRINRNAALRTAGVFASYTASTQTLTVTGPAQGPDMLAVGATGTPGPTVSAQIDDQPLPRSEQVTFGGMGGISSSGTNYVFTVNGLTVSAAGDDVSSVAAILTQAIQNDSRFQAQGIAALSPAAGQMQLLGPTTGLALSIDVGNTAATEVSRTLGRPFIGIGNSEHFTEQTIYDTQGQPHTIRTEFVKTAQNEWTIRLLERDVGNNWLQLNQQEIVATFGADGSLRSVAGGLNGTVSVSPLGGNFANTSPPWQWEGGTIDFNFGELGRAVGLTQFSSEFAVTDLVQDGLPYGQFAGVQIDEYGDVYAKYGNGASVRIYNLPLAVFANADGLQNVDGNAYRASAYSGDASILQPGVGQAGIIISEAIEASNVDIAEEFTHMIQTQRAYSANSRIVTTSDEMMDEVLRMKR